jgi:hypothetical protein
MLVQNATLAACGHMYLDEGEELEVGSGRDNLLAFDAAVAPSGNAIAGQVRLRACRLVNLSVRMAASRSAMHLNRLACTA